MGIFPEGEDSRVDHGLGRLVGFRCKVPPGTTSSYITTHHPDNVTASHGRPNLRNRLHFCHTKEGRPRSPQGRVGHWEKKKLVIAADGPMHLAEGLLRRLEPTLKEIK